MNIAVIAGALAGAAVGSVYLVIKMIRHNSNKEDLIIQHELNKFKFDPHDVELDRFVEDVSKYERPEPSFETVMAETEHPEDDEPEDDDLVDDSEEEEVTDEEEEVFDEDKEMEEYEEQANEYVGTFEPYLIQEETYFRLHDGYDKISLSWSESEGLLRDDEDDTVLDISKFIGYDSLEHFGDYSDPRCVYVRNERMRTDFEVTRE